MPKKRTPTLTYCTREQKLTKHLEGSKKIYLDPRNRPLMRSKCHSCGAQKTFYLPYDYPIKATQFSS